MWADSSLSADLHRPASRAGFTQKRRILQLLPRKEDGIVVLPTSGGSQATPEQRPGRSEPEG